MPYVHGAIDNDRAGTRVDVVEMLAADDTAMYADGVDVETGGVHIDDEGADAGDIGVAGAGAALGIGAGSSFSASPRLSLGLDHIGKRGRPRSPILGNRGRHRAPIRGKGIGRTRSPLP